MPSFRTAAIIYVALMALGIASEAVSIPGAFFAAFALTWNICLVWTVLAFLYEILITPY